MKRHRILTHFLNVPAKQQAANGFVMPYGDCPLDKDKVGEQVYMDMLNRAQKYVHIMTPYLILDGELEKRSSMPPSAVLMCGSPPGVPVSTSPLPLR